MNEFSEYNESLKAFEKANNAIENAEYNLKGNYCLAVANRSYYACDYCMTALLYTQDIYAKTHHGLRNKFSELFIKTELFPSIISELISILFDTASRLITIWIQI